MNLHPSPTEVLVDHPPNEGQAATGASPELKSSHVGARTLHGYTHEPSSTLAVGS